MLSGFGFLYQKMVLFGGAFSVSVSTLFLALFSLICKFFYRVETHESCCCESDSNSLTVPLPENNQLDSTPMNPEAEFDLPKPEKTDTDEDETPKFIFKFEFQIYKENLDSVSSTTTNKYEFKPEKCLSGFLEEPEDVSFRVKELFSGSNEDAVGEEEEEEKNEGCDQDDQFLLGKDFVALDSDSDSITSSNEFSAVSPFLGSTNDGFLSDRDFEEAFELDALRDLDCENGNEEVEESNLNNSSTEEKEMLSESDFHDTKNESMSENSGAKVTDKSNMENSSGAVDSEDANGLETLWEHQDLIDQLKMELKKVRAIGLPTILEESESPKIMEDLKPWKIDDNKFHHEDTMGELHKFYKSYRERMRKFDIFNYQKMYAIGFLQSKDPLQSISSLKPTTPGMTSLFPQNFLLSKRKKSELDPMEKFIDELHSDLEVVYVGQLCLSWEILHWQYEKSLELWDSDPYGIRKYNEVAGEFQQFQVLMQRFIENEAFEGPRVQNYIKNRCVLRNLLQVPVIREDKLKDKKARTKGRDDYAITSDTLVEIMEESIRIFWRFVRADKDTSIAVQKSRKGTQIEPQDTLDLELLSQVRTCLQKKEKKLKDILRSGNCILRKFQKHHEDTSDQVLYFFSQVDMKLVARVLNMSKITTDQLLWCRNKLSKINFVSRKIHVEPSFLLFPC